MGRSYMNLARTDDQRMIRDAAASFLADASDGAAVRKAVETPAGYDAQVWAQLGGELGWCGTAIAESHGGLGLSPVELSLIVEQMGRRLLPGPFFATVCLAGTLLAEAGTREARTQWLPRIAAGTLRATALIEGGALTAKKAKGGWQVSGTAVVADGGSAELLLLGAGQGRDAKVLAVRSDAKGLSAAPLTTWDATRRFARVTLRNVAAERVDDPAAKDGIARALALSRLYLAAEQLGGAQQCLDLAVAYVGQRKQFGRPIASFQAIKHRCAGMMVSVEALRSAVTGAAALAASRPKLAELERECAMAKALASDAFFACAQEAIQLHGGVGFTWEFDPHLYFKRAQAGSHWLGTSEALRERVAATLLD